MDSPEFPRRFGKYILLNRLNSGGMAEVFLARVTGIADFQRMIAIKCIKPALAANAQFAAMFVDEANLAGQLMHPNVVQIYELGRYKDQLYIAMELIDGRDLRQIVKHAYEHEQTVPLNFAAFAVSKAAEGLDYAHRHASPDGTPLELIHRDVSPQNILVSFNGGVKLVDFGIAKASDRTSDTSTGILKGKFSYMAPEQVRGRKLDRRADIFTLGSVLYELVAGEKLFDGDTDLEVVEKVRSATIPDLREKIPNAPDDLLAVLRRALAPEPANRFQWASEMARELEPLLINDRRIFGTQDAAAMMHNLFGDAKQVEQTPYDDNLDGDASAPSRRDQHIFSSHFSESEDSEDRLPAGAEREQEQDPENEWRTPTMEMSRHAFANSHEGDFLSETTDERGYVDDSEQTERRYASGAYEREQFDRDPDEFDNTDTPPASPIKRLKVWLGTSTGRLAMMGSAGLFVGMLAVLTLTGDNAPKPDEASTTAAAADAQRTTPKSGARHAWGYINVKVQGGRHAKVFIDGKEIGPAPLKGHRLRLGTHTIRVTERRKGRGRARTRSKSVAITSKATRKSPETIVFSL